jgi:hypothetical protein
MNIGTHQLCLTGELKAIDPRHHDIGDDEIDPPLGQQTDRLIPVRRRQNGLIRLRERRRDDLPQFRLVIDHQDGMHARHTLKNVAEPVLF